ncbi:MAG: HNH endonuclease signature motif containing protein [Acidobacteriota bacterium]
MSSDRPSPKLRHLVAERAQWRCEYCLSPSAYSMQSLEADHIIPISKGGRNTADNLALSCGCNRFKSNKTHARDPRTGKLAPLFNPRRQEWSKHFEWSADSLSIIGRTATGRATVEELNLNRRQLINLRRALIAIGEHP